MKNSLSDRGWVSFVGGFLVIAGRMLTRDFIIVDGCQVCQARD